MPASPGFSRTSPHSTCSTFHSSVLGTDSQASLCHGEDPWMLGMQKWSRSHVILQRWSSRCGGKGSPPGSFQRALESHRLGCSRLRWWKLLWDSSELLQLMENFWEPPFMHAIPREASVLWTEPCNNHHRWGRTGYYTLNIMIALRRASTDELSAAFKWT